jgi:hypothetical protein
MIRDLDVAFDGCSIKPRSSQDENGREHQLNKVTGGVPIT